MKYKVCILAAGKGARNSWANSSHKSLLPIQNKAAISFIIEKYNDAYEFVIAAGYKSRLLEDYLKIAHPNVRIRIVIVKNYSAKGSGPGHSLIKCKKYLQLPFISHACDAICMNTHAKPNKDWIAYDIKKKGDQVVAALNNKIGKDLFYKTTLKNKTKVFIGVAGIYNYKKFWSNLKSQNYYSKKFKSKLKTEKQMLDGFSIFFNNKIKFIKYNWWDIGTDYNYRQFLYSNKDTKNLVLPKKKEFIYFQNNLVIKYFSNKTIAYQRYKRSKIIKTFMPGKVGYLGNFLYYPYINGKILSKIKSDKVFLNLLSNLNKKLWIEKKLNKNQLNSFIKECNKFYKYKTIKRVNLFLKQKKYLDQYKFINNIKVHSIKKILKKIDWKTLSKGTPVNFHGDTAPNNIIIQNSRKFNLIDWRENFGSLLNYGDLYYDLSKMYHALILPQLLDTGNYISIKSKKDNILFSFKSFNNLKLFKKNFEDFSLKNNLDLKKVKILSYLIFLNIAPLHEGKISDLFFLYGKVKLSGFINEK